jgi:hypothetical protein
MGMTGYCRFGDSGIRRGLGEVLPFFLMEWSGECIGSLLGVDFYRKNARSQQPSNLAFVYEQGVLGQEKNATMTVFLKYWPGNAHSDPEFANIDLFYRQNNILSFGDAETRFLNSMLSEQSKITPKNLLFSA